MPFTGHENHDIPLAEAAQLTANFRNANPGQTQGWFYGMDAISGILAQPGCVGIRIYNGQTASGERNLVITGVDAAGNDLFNGPLAEFGSPCPTTCSIANPLNS